MLVAELIRDDQWHLDPLAQDISSEASDLIRQIPLLPRWPEDKLIWTRNKDGEYSVKKAYRSRVKEPKGAENTKASSSYSVSPDTWRQIWKLETIPRVRNFMWRVMNKAIASKEALFHWKCAPDPLCPICENEVETPEHLFLLCPWVRRAWYVAPVQLRLDEFNVTRVEKWIEAFLLQPELEATGVREYIACHLWSIWKIRCQWVFERVEPHPMKAVLDAKDLMQGFLATKEINAANETPVATTTHGGWQKPPSHCLKLNCDGAFCAPISRGGLGVVVRDSNGDFVQGYADCFISESALFSELQALKRAIIMTDTWPDSDLIIELDCKDLYKAVSTNSFGGFDWRYHRYLSEIFLLM